MERLESACNLSGKPRARSDKTDRTRPVTPFVSSVSSICARFRNKYLTGQHSATRFSGMAETVLPMAGLRLCALAALLWRHGLPAYCFLRVGSPAGRGSMHTGHF